MKRFFLFLLLAACGTSNDDTIVDGSIDQSQESSANDATTDVGKQDVGSDVQQDVQADVSDATTDVITSDAGGDAIVDVITIDVKNGCVDNNGCNGNEFCDKGTANCNGVGKCTQVPQFCPQIVNPVCGCDKKTYNNSCYANKGLTSVAYTGVCE
jgi:hypothetical protein